jgi:phosphatidylserine/phosphatidylglycerophosphate/cardiolipin synthase-like enzyme
MNKRISTILISILLVFSLSIPLSAVDLTLNNTPIQVYFSPDGGCTNAINKILGQSKQEILVQAYSFTSAPIAKALLEAHKRGVKVQVILDKSQKTHKYSSATFLKNSRIPTFIDDNHAIAHNKIMIIDREIVITGSFNFTKAAEEKNAENLLIIRDKGFTRFILRIGMKHKGHSEKYSGK